MDTTFTYNGKSWKRSLTTSDYNSFFHSVYGTRTEGSGAYFDKQAEFRRMRWATFLTYFKNENMPSCLADTLRKCMSANEYEQEHIDNKQDLAKYISNITAGQQAITEEDIPILATLENVKVVLFSAGRPDPLRIVEPDSRILGSCSIALERYKEVVLCLERNIFVRLEPLQKNNTPKLDKNKAKKKTNTSKYKKVGCAGSKGVQYQVSLLAVIILNAMKNALSGWKLSTENEEAGKFDDVVFECSEETVLIQAKHRDSDKKITFEDLTSLSYKNNDFSLPKYLLSYLSIKEKFNIKNVILCTNADVNEKALRFLNRQDVNKESLLHYEDGDCSFYMLNDEILPVLKEKTILYHDENFKNKDVQKPNITEENLRDFQKQLQIYFNYPPLNSLKKVIEKLLSFTKFSSNLHGKITATEIYSKVLDWFHQNEGIYFKEIHTKASFADIWSDKYCQKLENYKIFLNKNDLNFQDPKQIFHVTSSHGNLLQAIKIYRTMQNYKEKTLFVNPDDDIDTQKLILEAFGLPQYVFLVIIKLKFVEKSVITEICDKLRDIIEKKKYKKIILTTGCNDAFFRCIAHKENDYKLVDGSVTFEDLSEASRQGLLEKESVIFQGNSICLKELLGDQTMEGYIRVLDSQILENIITGKVKVGEQPNWKENIPYFYINRSFKTSAGQKLEDDIYNVKEDMVLISNDAGMGKSTVLSKLAIIIKEANPHLWVIKIELTEYTRFLRDQGDKESISIMDLLNSKKATKLTNNLERFVFSMNTKVVLMLDGVDEISPHYTKLVLKLLNQCTKANNFAKLFVTTRPHKVQELQTILKNELFELQPLTKQNQVDFLTSYWAHNLKVTPENKEKCERYALELINRMTSWTKGHHNHKDDFIAIALQLRMVAEIFKESIKLNKSSDWEGCKEYIEKTAGEPKLPEKIELKELYDLFIEKKRDIYVNKGNPNGNPEANVTLIRQFNESLTYHKILASDVILPRRAKNIFSCYHQDLENITESVLKMGIVHSSKGKAYFIHRTFAEYFVAGRLVDELQLQLHRPNIKFQKFFIDEILNNSNYKIIRVFLDSFLENIIDLIPRNIFKCYQLHMSPYSSKNAGFIHLCAEESCITILQLILKCINFKIIRNKKVCIRYTFACPKEILEAKNTLQLIDGYVQNGGINIMDEYGRTPLYYAVDHNHYKMVRFLTDQGANINLRGYDNNAVLHLAAIKGYLDIAKYLVNQKCDIDIPGKLLRTPLNLAALNGCFEMVKFLVEAGADLNIVDSKGCTALQSALYSGHSEIVTYLKKLEIKGKEN